MGGPTQTKKKQITCDILSIDIYRTLCYYMGNVKYKHNVTLGLSPDPLATGIGITVNGSGVKNTGEPQRGVMDLGSSVEGPFNDGIDCLLGQAPSIKHQA